MGSHCFYVGLTSLGPQPIPGDSTRGGGDGDKQDLPDASDLATVPSHHHDIWKVMASVSLPLSKSLRNFFLWPALTGITGRVLSNIVPSISHNTIQCSGYTLAHLLQAIWLLFQSIFANYSSLF